MPSQSLDLVGHLGSISPLRATLHLPSPTGRGSTSPLSCRPGLGQAPAVPLPFQDRETRQEAQGMVPRFSFLRFPQFKSLGILLLTLLDNLR